MGDQTNRAPAPRTGRPDHVRRLQERSAVQRGDPEVGPEPAGRHEQQDTRDLNPPEPAMPSREPDSKPFTDQDQSQDQRGGSGEDVRVERPAIDAREVILPPVQEVRIEIGGEVARISRQNAECDPQDQEARQEGQDTLRRRSTIWPHFGRSKLSGVTDAAATRRGPITSRRHLEGFVETPRARPRSRYMGSAGLGRRLRVQTRRTAAGLSAVSIRLRIFSYRTWS